MAENNINAFVRGAASYMMAAPCLFFGEMNFLKKIPNPYKKATARGISTVLLPVTGSFACKKLNMEEFHARVD